MSGTQEEVMQLSEGNASALFSEHHNNTPKRPALVAQQHGAHGGGSGGGGMTVAGASVSLSSLAGGASPSLSEQLAAHFAGEGSTFTAADTTANADTAVFSSFAAGAAAKTRPASGNRHVALRNSQQQQHQEESSSFRRRAEAERVGGRSRGVSSSPASFSAAACGEDGADCGEGGVASIIGDQQWVDGRERAPSAAFLANNGASPTTSGRAASGGAGGAMVDSIDAFANTSSTNQLNTLNANTTPLQQAAAAASEQFQPHTSQSSPQMRRNVTSDGFLPRHESQPPQQLASMVSFEGIPNAAGNTNSSAYFNNTNNNNNDNASMSGYSASRGGGFGAESTVIEDLNSAYYTRLVRFYEKYNPEKIERAEEFLSAYKGEEEDLFRVLCEKYGPEPEPPKRLANSMVLSPSDPSNTSFHFLGPKAIQVPDKVSPSDGRTEQSTPYWPMCRLVTDRDILALFLQQSTDNTELRKCFIGFLASHPLQAWNGMTYLSSCPLPNDVTRPFLGHTWTGTLANNKTLLYKTDYFRRTVLHCTEECQQCPLPPPAGKRNSDLKAAGGEGGGSPLSTNANGSFDKSPLASGGGGGMASQSQQGSEGSAVQSPQAPCPGCSDCKPPLLAAAGASINSGVQTTTSAGSNGSSSSGVGHGRWRLVIYHVETCPYALFRVMYDPVLPVMPTPATAPVADGAVDAPSPPSGDSAKAGNKAKEASNVGAPPPVAAKKSNFFTFSFSRKSKEKNDPQKQPVRSPSPNSNPHNDHSGTREPLIMNSAVRSLRRDAQQTAAQGPPPPLSAAGNGYRPSADRYIADGSHRSSRSSSVASSSVGGSEVPVRAPHQYHHHHHRNLYAQPSQPVAVNAANRGGVLSGAQQPAAPSYGEVVHTNTTHNAVTEGATTTHHSNNESSSSSAMLVALLQGFEGRMLRQFELLNQRVGSLERTVEYMKERQEELAAPSGKR